MAGIKIYSITNPQGHVYIGQTKDIEKRISKYKRGSSNYCVKVKESINKNGFDSHSIKVLTELPVDTEPFIIDEYERFYITQYKSVGITMMNIYNGGKSGFSIPKKQKQKISNSLLGIKHTEERKKAVSDAVKIWWQKRKNLLCQ